MSISVECLVRSAFREFDNLKVVEAELNRAAGVLNELFHLGGVYMFGPQLWNTDGYTIYSDSDTCPIYRLYLKRGYWHVISGYRYSELFVPNLWLRQTFVNIAKALGQHEAWYCDEFHLDNCGSPKWDYDTQTFDEWLTFAESVIGIIPEFLVEDVKFFTGDRFPSKPIYHDSF